MKIIGIMTGTSLDAVDIALADITEKSLDIIAYDEIKINSVFRDKIIEISENPVYIKDISSLNFAVSEIYFRALKEFSSKHRILLSRCDAIGIHGQTVWHQPVPDMISNIRIASTLQLGNPVYLSKKTGLKVISDFRSGDIAYGGQGAPLVPVFDKQFLFSGKNTIALNIGGIANVTFIPKSGNENEIIAFDTGPGNMLIDIMTSKLFGEKYDKNGEIANNGKLIPEFYEELMEMEYLKRKPPKSTGRELFNFNLINKLIRQEYKSENIIRTLTEFTASTIAINIKMVCNTNAEIIASGGGAKNRFLMNLLKDKLKGYDLFISDQKGIPSDAKEALCFAYLAYLNLEKLPGNLPSVTGASQKTVLGSVSYP